MATLRWLLANAAYFALYGLLIQQSLVIGRQWYMRWRLFGWPTWRECRLQLMLDKGRDWSWFGVGRFHVVADMATNSGYAALFWILGAWLRLVWLRHLAILYAFLAVWSLAARALPPSILLLAASSPEADALYVLLAAATTPLHLACLLLIGRTEGPQSGNAGGRPRRRRLRPVPSTYYRTSDSTAWMQAVETLTDLVALIVIDARAITPHVGGELARLAERHTLGKLLFVATPERDAPVIAAVEQTLKRPLTVAGDRIVTVNELPAWCEERFTGVGHWRSGWGKYVDYWLLGL